MIPKVRPCMLALLIAPLALAAAEPRPAESRVESLGLFKNGLFMVRETISISGPGTYHLDAVPKAIHGTLWFDSDAVFEARAITREETRPAATPRSIAEAARLHANREVHLELVDGNKIAGIVVPSVAYPAPAPVMPHGSPFGASLMSSTATVHSDNIIVLRTDSVDHYITAGSVRSLKAGFDETVQNRTFTETTNVPSLELVVRDVPSAGSTITMTYLTDGMAWAPSYRIDFDPAGSARVTMSTIVRNEWRDVADTRVDLISGFPQIEYSGATSPLWHETTLASFFSQLSNHSAPHGGAIMSQMVMSNMAMPISSSTLDLSSGVSGAGEDLHFLDMGSLTLARGSAINRQIAAADTTAERFVDWRITDDRDAHGRSSGQESANDAWDSIRFTNPFDFAMTTAPTAVWMDGKFRGQSTTTFTNPGAEAIVRTTKALSVETIHEEFDIGRGDPRRIAHSDYQPVTVRAEMKVTNRRNTAATIEITREFQGTKLSVSDEPEKLRTASKRNAVNPTNEARWILEVPAGEERLVTVDYEVLVRI